MFELEFKGIKKNLQEFKVINQRSSMELKRSQWNLKVF